MFENLRSDFRLAVGSSGFRIALFTLLLSHSFHLVMAVRFGCFCYRFGFLGRILSAVVEYFIRIFFSSDISCKAIIGPGLVLMHGHDIVIGADVVIGSGCKIFNGVTLGNKDTEASGSAQPKVGDNVVLGTGAKILGGIKVGSGTYVGANAVLLKNTKPGSVWVGVPAKEVRKV